MEKQKCRGCGGTGRKMRPNGYTSADIVDHPRCNGTGWVEAKPKQNYSQSRGRHIRKNEGMEELKFVEAV